MTDTLGKKIVKNSKEQGIVIAEAALCIVLLILLLSIIVDLGFAMKEHAAMVEASRSAAVAAVKVGNQTPEARAENTARNVLLGSGFDANSYTYEIQTIQIPNVGISTGRFSQIGDGLAISITKPAEGRFSIFRRTFDSQVSTTILTDFDIYGANSFGCDDNLGYINCPDQP